VVTMADVAREAGVSVSTVSHVLNRTRPVRQETEALVRAAVERTGYIQDGIARSMVTGGTTTVGVAMSAISNPYFGEVLQAIERTLAAAGYSLLLVDTHDDPDLELKAIESVLARRVDAIVLAPSSEPGRSLARAARAGVPVIILDRLVRAPLDQVGSYNTAPTAQLVDHLVGHGHHRIAMISGRDGLATTEERVKGYRRGLRDHGIAFAPELLVGGDGSDDVAEQAVARLLRLEDPPTAVVVGNNLMTIGAMRGLRAAGLRVPSDMALVAFDDFSWSDLFHPRLTTMAQPTTELGERTVELLLARLADPDRPPQRVRLRTSLVLRESCGCPPG
jgi:LacI family transcriptional regulator